MQNGALGVVSDLEVESQLAGEPLKGTSLSRPLRGDEHLWMLSAEAKPLLLMATKLARREPTTLRMLGVVVVHLGMTFKTERYRILDPATVRRIGRLDMVNFDLHTAEAMADAASPMAGDKERLDVLAIKFLPTLTARPGAS